MKMSHGGLSGLSPPQRRIQTNLSCFERRRLKYKRRCQQCVAAVVKLYSTSWNHCLPSIISRAGLASAFSTSGTGYFCSSHHESLTLCPVIWIEILAPVLNGCAILLALCKPTPLLSIIGPVKPSPVRFWLVPRAVFWLVPYLPLLCQQVGGLDSVSLWQEVDKSDPASTFFLSFFFCVCVSSGV